MTVENVFSFVSPQRQHGKSNNSAIHGSNNAKHSYYYCYKTLLQMFRLKLPSELLEIRFKKFMFKRSFLPHTRLFYDTLCTYSIIVGFFNFVVFLQVMYYCVCMFYRSGSGKFGSRQQGWKMQEQTSRMESRTDSGGLSFLQWQLARCGIRDVMQGSSEHKMYRV